MYITMELNVLYLKLYEIQWNQRAEAILPFIAFLELINSLLLICRPLGCKMSQGLYINL